MQFVNPGADIPQVSPGSLVNETCQYPFTDELAARSPSHYRHGRVLIPATHRPTRSLSPICPGRAMGGRDKNPAMTVGMGISSHK